MSKNFKSKVEEDKKLNKELFGDMDGLIFGSSDEDSDDRVVYPFNCPPLDIPLGGGIVSGKIYEVFGPESHGKSTWALDISKIFCDYWEKSGELYRVVWIESESAFDDVRATFMGCPITTKFIFKKTDIFEEGRDTIKAMLERALKKKMHLLFVWDTIAAVSTLKEKEGSAVEDADDDDDKSKANRGGLMEKPRLLKAMFRDITHPLGETHSTLVLVNQISIKSQGKFMFTTDSSGGHALRHHASVRARIDRNSADDYAPIDKSGRAVLQATKPVISFAKNKITGYTKYQVQMYVDLNSGLDTLETRLLFLKRSKLVPPAAGGWTTISIPSSYATKPMEKLDMMELKFNTSASFKNLCEKHPHMVDWLDYLTYKTFIADSPLVKIKNIEKIWTYEEKFYGQHLTKLAQDEREAANMMYKTAIKDADMEIAVEKEETKEDKKPVIPAKVVSGKKPLAVKENHVN
jgi:RecA/RadA recombinase